MNTESRSKIRAGSTSPTTADRVRQAVVTGSAIIAVVGALVGSGFIGGEPMEDAAGGAFSADATPIAPGGPAFSIWSVIYAGLVAYTIWQWLPRNASALRHRRAGYLIAASMLLNAAWLFAVQAALLPLTVVIIVVLLITLIIAFIALRRTPPSGALDAFISDGTVGLYLGWVIVATAANVAAVLAAEGFTVENPDVWAIVVLAVAGLAAAALAVWDRGRIAPSLAVVWGLVWVGIARLTGDLESTSTAITAFIVALAVAITTLASRLMPARRSR